MSLRLAAVALLLAAAPAWEPGRVTPEQLKRAMQDDQRIHVVDVRSPQAYAQGHIPGAVNMPFAGLREGAKPPAWLHKGNPVYLYCT